MKIFKSRQDTNNLSGRVRPQKFMGQIGTADFCNLVIESVSLVFFAVIFSMWKTSTIILLFITGNNWLFLDGQRGPSAEASTA